MEFIIADMTHLDFLLQLEISSFEPEKRVSKKSLKNSIQSKNQLVIIAVKNNVFIASATLFLYKTSVRIYSIAVIQEQQRNGIGTSILDYILDFSKSKGYQKITLEADSTNKKLIDFYLNYGFEIQKTLKSYYSEKKDGFKMTYLLSSVSKNVVITDYETSFFNNIENVICIRAQEYIENPYYQNMKNIKVFNLCKSMKYQSVGYYVSLLGYARNHRVYPSTSTLRDLKSKTLLRSIGEEVYEQIQEAFENCLEKKVILDNYFGFSSNIGYQKLLDSISVLFELPLCRFEFRKNLHWELFRVYPIQLDDVKSINSISEKARHYFSTKKFNIGVLNYYDYNLAILVDDHELNPPSDKHALLNFKKAAEKYNFYVEFISKRDYSRLTEFDALLIRTTTSLNNYTYDFSRLAYSEGLVVIDDPWSIMGCSNKLFLHEKMNLNGIKMPQTWFLNKKNKYSEMVGKLSFPLILKQPDSAFSKGVHKVECENELIDLLNKLFKTSEIIIAQQFIPSDFDWRIGILNGKALYACKYYMAKGHWQIYNWNSNTENQEGDFETIQVENVPEDVLNLALKASMLIGDGLYGVDVKEIDGEVYLIEVNDNPNIDSGIEDKVIGNSLYDSIISVIYDRIDNPKKYDRIVSS